MIIEIVQDLNTAVDVVEGFAEHAGATERLDRIQEPRCQTVDVCQPPDLKRM